MPARLVVGPAHGYPPGVRAHLVMGLWLLPACVETADAQPRPDGGRRFVVRPPANERPQRVDFRQANRAVQALRAMGDGGVASVIGARPLDDTAAFQPGGLGRYRLTGTLPDGGVSLGSFGGGGLGTRGSGPGSGTGMGYGRMGTGTPRDAHFIEVTVQGDLPRWAVTSELSRAAVRIHNCLITVGPHGPVDVPVRLTVRPPTTVQGVTVDDTPAHVARCAVAGLQRMILGPVTAPVQIGARLRAEGRGGATPSPPGR